MIVPPSPTTPRSPLRRTLRAAGLVLAPLLLVMVIAIGIAGPKDEPVPRPSPVPPPSPVALASAPVAAPASALPPASPPAVRSGVPSWARGTPAPADFPDTFAGLESVTAAKALERRADGGANGAILVRGWMKAQAPAGGCSGGSLGPLGPWCVRTAILAEHAWAVTGADFDPLPAHLHLAIPIGVRLPEPLAHMATADAGPPLPVEVVGRFSGTRCAPADLAWCEEPFVVDRIAWADGVRAALTPLTEDRLASVRRRPNPFLVVTAEGRTPLLGVLAWPDTVRKLDPATSTALGQLPSSEPVWYVRILGGGGRDDAAIGGDPAVRWVLLDERHLDVLASGRTAVDADAATTGASPAELAARPLLDPSVGTGARLRALRVQASVTSLATGRWGTVLASALVRPARLAGVDAAASDVLDALIARTGSRPGAVWYVRARPIGLGASIFPPGDAPPQDTWLVADASTGVVLASGIEAPAATRD